MWQIQRNNDKIKICIFTVAGHEGHGYINEFLDDAVLVLIQRVKKTELRLEMMILYVLGMVCYLLLSDLEYPG
ncbi:MAG: hypothetical protein L6416_08060 [Candidatus Omnitrophica bacterium]|nr:hypothetical protein [Candidatus Omnitrophota bacterium]